MTNSNPAIGEVCPPFLRRRRAEFGTNDTAAGSKIRPKLGKWRTLSIQPRFAAELPSLPEQPEEPGEESLSPWVRRARP